MKPPPSFIRVILIQENQADQWLIVNLLRDEGAGQFILCGIFRNLQDALKSLQDPDGGVDVVLLDFRLPDSQGLDAFSRLAKAVPEQPVVILCGADDQAIAKEAVQKGALDYLVKNELSGKLLVRSLRYAVERKHAECALKSLQEEMNARLEEHALLLSKTRERLAEVADELKIARDAVSTNERMRIIDRLVPGIAHDFNNALSPILAHSEWLLHKPELLCDERTVRDALGDIQKSAERCADEVLRLRDLCRAEDRPLQMEPLDICHVLNEAISITRPSWNDQAQMRGCNITVKAELGAVPKIRGVRDDLVEMFTDLILNAVDAIRCNGIISISASCPDEDHVDVCVADNGVGSVCERGDPKECYPEPFRNGLGLGMVYGIAQRHGAEVLLSSWIEGGTSISIRFAVSKEEAVKLQKPAMGRISERLRILAVEDEANIREILGLYLVDIGHQVELAADGQEALSKFKRNRFDLLLTDCSMPNMSGDSLAAAVRAADPKIRIALLTGFGAQLPQGAPLRLEVDAIIAKPFTFESLKQGIAEAMNG